MICLAREVAITSTYMRSVSFTELLRKLKIGRRSTARSKQAITTSIKVKPDLIFFMITIFSILPHQTESSNK
jgi:hypothetical protein